ncbi:GSCFA domain-containing protein [Tenacibaculum sp. TC6]|uniref:GSCFA domain-containing protein n=1 Tax=Tenacibaculum sp. TC6 TaxID=3423223 RepID=UPI003D363E6F
MILQTQIPLSSQQYHQITYQSKLVLLGSCFSENIGHKLSYYKFQSSQNPLGILFQPKAIENLITHSINKKDYTEKDIFFYNERWHCFDAHSALSCENSEDLLTQLNTSLTASLEQLTQATHVIITLGTSWVYRHIETDTIVANCHKVPQKKFLKELLSVDEISESLEAINALLKSINSNVAIIYTVSPVRHLKDGFIENQRSKAHLLSAIHAIANTRKAVYYFPSYEIMMDELRDYRFYTEDMIHPNLTAINYIWEKFIHVWIDNTVHPTMQEVETIQKGLLHRPFNPNSEQHQVFLKNLELKIKTLSTAFPFIQF